MQATIKALKEMTSSIHHILLWHAWIIIRLQHSWHIGAPVGQYCIMATRRGLVYNELQ